MGVGLISAVCEGVDGGSGCGAVCVWEWMGLITAITVYSVLCIVNI